MTPKEIRVSQVRLVRSFTSDVEDLARLLVEGLDEMEWYARFDAYLLEALRGTWKNGRLLANSDKGGDDLDHLAAIAQRDAQSQYLQSFLADIQDGRYTDEDGNLSYSAVSNRSRYYASRLRGTANESWVAHTPEDLGFIWKLGATEHCADCIRMPELMPDGGFTNSTLPFFPADGSTECKMNCACWLERMDGVIGFKRV